MDIAKLEKKVTDFAAGDKSAFDFIYRCTNRAVYFSALYIVRDKAYAEDIMQETYMRALGAIESYATGTNFTAWIVRIAKNLALNHVKRGAREKSSDFTDEAEIRKYGSAETELPYVFEVAARTLPNDEYQIVMLCHVCGYKRREVAAMLDMPTATVTWKNNQALKKLRNTLKKEGGL